MREHKRQRVRDPLHDLIEFDEGNPFEGMLWRVIKTAPFQRLRRIRQLGFSELVYPGATHSRFIHSLGVFHTARHLMHIVDRFTGDIPTERIRREAALAAPLVHDVGHGPFSHAFETIGKRFGWTLVSEHENHSDALIRSTEPGAIGEILNGYRTGFANDVADVLRQGPETVYGSIVSSQFDADRLDYVRRDRLMTGTRLASVDFEWLMANLEVGDLPQVTGAPKRRTLVLGPKAIYAAEAFVTGVFQMYPTVYLHKTTRGAEKMVQAMLERIAERVTAGEIGATGLPENHPIVAFFVQPNQLSALADLDDAVIFGALPMLSKASDSLVSGFSERLRTRRLFKAIDLHHALNSGLSLKPVKPRARAKVENLYLRRREKVEEDIQAWLAEDRGRQGRILLDAAQRPPYKSIEEEGPLNQIWIRDGEDLVDLRSRSLSVAAIDTYRAFRAYVAEDDEEARRFVDECASKVVEEMKP